MSIVIRPGDVVAYTGSLKTAWGLYEVVEQILPSPRTDRAAAYRLRAIHDSRALTNVSRWNLTPTGRRLGGHTANWAHLITD